MSYWALFAVLALARSSDFVSTWLVTPDLSLESNPIVKRLGWQRSAILDLCLCFMLAVDQHLAMPVATASLLVASRNCDLSGGRYRRTCVLLAASLMAIIGYALLCCSFDLRMDIAWGIVLYAALSLVFRRVWRKRGRPDWGGKIFVRR